MKKQGKITVAVSGGFDPIHRGHVRLIHAARALGDELVVILNNDCWLKAKKGFVFMPEDERKEILESLACVDRVFVTRHPRNPSDMSVSSALLSVRPDIFANGGDRTRKNTPEDAACTSIGCKMAFGVGKGGKVQSSSWLVEKHIRRRKLRETAAQMSSKKVVMFDVDGTLTKSKMPLDGEMSSLLCDLLAERKVAVMSGAHYTQFQEQFLKHFHCAPERLKNLLLLPVSGASFYAYGGGGWRTVYEKRLSAPEKKKIIGAFEHAFQRSGYTHPKKTYGEIIEDRGSQFTFSALGQKAPLAAKVKWHTTLDVRPKLKKLLDKVLPAFTVRLGGLTSIDITKKGIDKAYGVKEAARYLSVGKKDMVYLGDALQKGGNDYAVKSAGVDTVAVKDESETKQFIDAFLIAVKERRPKG